MNLHKNRIMSAFTMIEMLVVLGITGVFIGIAVPSYMKYVEISNESECLNRRRAIESAKSSYTSDFGSVETTVPINNREMFYSYFPYSINPALTVPEINVFQCPSDSSTIYSNIFNLYQKTTCAIHSQPVD